MKFYITGNYYGGNINIIEQAAKMVNAELIAVREYALSDYPGKRDYVDGCAEYIFLLERGTLKEARKAIDVEIHKKISDLWLAAREKQN